MMTEGDLMRVIEETKDDAIAAGRVVPKSWLTHEVVKKFRAEPGAPTEGVGADFFLGCGFVATAALVSKSYRHPADKKEQLSFEGYERLQSSYAVVREVDGETEPCFVPTELLTDDEIDAKADELDAMAEGLKAHARELRRYKEDRRAATHRAKKRTARPAEQTRNA